MSRHKGDLYVVADQKESFSVLVLFKEKFDSLHSQMNQKLQKEKEALAKYWPITDYSPIDLRNMMLWWKLFNNEAVVSKKE